MRNLVEIALAQPEQRRAKDLGVSPDPVMQRGAEAIALRIGPGLVGLIFAVDEDRLRAPVRLLAREILAAFEDEDAL